MDVNGAVAEGFEPVREAFIRNFGTLGERGAAVAVYLDGRKVADLWAGTKDVDGTQPWQHGTAQVVRSATKGVAAAVPLILRQRGQLDLDAPVGEYWPEFKAHGKERLLVRHVLNHRAGLPVLDRPLTPEEALDPHRGPEAVAAQAPAWVPGTDHGYHALTYGWLLDELVRRVTGRWAGEWLAAEIAGPLGLDLWLGLPESEAGRVGRTGRVEGPEPAGGLRARPRRSVTEAYQDPASLTRRAFAAITPSPTRTTPPTVPPPSPRRTASRRPTDWPASTPRSSARSTGYGSSTRRRWSWRGPRSRRGRTASWWSTPVSVLVTCCTAARPRCWVRVPSATRAAAAPSASPTRRRGSPSAM